MLAKLSTMSLDSLTNPKTLSTQIVSIDNQIQCLLFPVIMAMQSSELSVVKTLFPENEERSSKRPVTVATQFKTAVNELVKTLLSATPHYVRCVKSNHKKQGFYFDEEC